VVGERLYEGTYAARLDNGLRIFVEEDPRSRSASIAAWIDIGARDDPEELHGVSHFIEHLTFKGTKTRSAVDISREIDSVGGSLNAATGRESTVFYADVPVEGVATAVDLVTDLVRNPAFEPEKIDLERGVVLDEIRGHDDDPESVAFDLFVSQVWKNAHPLSRPVLGAQEAVERMPWDRILEHHRRYYRPDRTVLAACGAVCAERLIEEIAAHYADDPSPAEDVSPRSAPEFGPGRHHHERDSGQSYIYMALLGGSATDPDRYAMEVLNALLGDGTSSRLFRAIREDRGLAYSIGSTALRYTDAGLWMIYAATAPELASEVRDRIEHELRLLLEDSVEEDELVRAKARLRGLFILGMESNANRAMRLGTAAIANREIGSPEEVLSKLDAVSSADLAAAVERFLQLDALHVTTVGPEG